MERIRLQNPSFRILAKHWWPVFVWLGVIRLESSDAASSDNTLGLLHTVLLFLFPHISGGWIWEINYLLRKTGHFMGYGVLGVLVFFAFRNTNRDSVAPALLRRWGTRLHDFWRMEWVWLSMAVAVITAALDEIHQSFIASRTGRWQDVALDACGSAVLQVMVYFYSLGALNRRRRCVERPEFPPNR